MVFELYSRLKLNILNSAQDSFIDDRDPDKEYIRYLDQSQPIFEFSIIKLFQINLLNLMRNKVNLSKNFYIAPSELDRMYYWEYEYLLEEVNNNIKEENDRQEKESSKYGDMNPKSIMKNMKSYSNVNTPSSNFKMPSMNSLK